MAKRTRKADEAEEPAPADGPREPGGEGGRGDGGRTIQVKLPTQSQVFFFILLAGMFYLTWLLFRDFVIFIVTGVFVAVLALPIDRLWEKVFPNRVAAVMTMLTVFVILTAPLVLLGFGMYRDVTHLATSLQNGELDHLADRALQQKWAQEGMDQLYPNQTLEQHNATLHGWIDDGQAALQDRLEEFGRHIVSAVPAFFVGLAIVLFVVYYLLTDGSVLYAYILRAAPLPPRQIDFLMKEAQKGLTGVFNGQILMSVLQGFIGGLGFLVVGLPNPVLWGAVMALFALLPVLGTFMIWVPAGLYLMATGKVLAGVFLLAYGVIIILVIVDTFLRPKLLGSSIDLHPLFVLVGVLGGAAVFGFIGLFLGPLLVGVLVSVLKVWEQEYLDPMIAKSGVPPPQHPPPRPHPPL
jgi:predicted PurR-regulated permease PerM